MNRLRILALAIAVTAPSADARQQVLYEIGGAQPEDQLGRVVSGAGDVNADGFSDFVLGGHLSDRGGRNAGLAEVYSGINGSILYTYTGSTGEGLGYVVSDVGDMDHDGHDDFALSSPYKNVIVGGIGGGLRTHAGMVDVRSGRDGSRIRSFAGSVSGMVLGRSMSGAGDTNNDGYPDIVFGSNTGVAWIHSGRDGIVLTTLTGIPGSSGPGLAVSSAGDFNGDGFDDVTGGDFAYQGFDGLIQVFSGLDGSELFRDVGSWPRSYLGYSVAEAGDVNGDGFGDVIAGAPGFDRTAIGHATVYSGVDGSVLHIFQGVNSILGESVSGAGDVDNDGHDDVIIGGPTATIDTDNDGRVWTHSGKNGALLFTMDGGAGRRYLGDSVAGAGDVDGDGYSDVVVGAPLTDFLSSDGGLAIVASGNECGSIRSVGVGCPAGGGFIPSLTVNGCMVLGESLSVSLSDGAGGAPAAVLISQTTSITTLPNGCQMAVGLPPMVVPLGILSGTGPGEGTASLSGTVTGPPGATYYVAALMQDGGNTITSNTLEIQVAP